MIDLSTLNENQREAVQWKGTPLLVLAGPGSGKTRVLTMRIARLLQESAGQHFRILALTFTNKAAAEMRERVEELVPRELSRVRLTTFHSYAAELLQQHGSHLGLRPDFQILSDDADREAVLETVLMELRKDLTQPLPEHFTAQRLLPLVNRMLENCISVEEAEALLQQNNIDHAVPFARVYTAYRKALRTTNALDFPSLIAEVLELFGKHPFLAKHIRKIFTHILVDEFQDTNHSQYRFLSCIAQPNPSTLFVVADDDQIIYQWNGASPERIQALQDNFHVAELQLPENYRCPPAVIDLANALIAHNLNRSAHKKPLKAIKISENGETIRVGGFSSEREEAAWIASDILRRNAQGHEQCAVLARTKKMLDVVGRALEDAGLDRYFAARKNDFTSAPLRILHSLLRLVNASEDKQSLARLCKAFFDLEGINIELSSVFERASADGQNLLYAWLEAVLLHPELRDVTRQLLETDIKPLLHSLNYRAFAESLFCWATNCREKTLSPEDTAFNEFEEEKEVWAEISNEIAKKFEGEDISLHHFLREVDFTSKASPKSVGAIPCFTIHASKGMEFDHVYLMGLVEDQLPSWAAVKKGDVSREMQEERRNCFVAITRAQKSLTLTYASHVFGWSKQASRFLKEMGIEA